LAKQQHFNDILLFLYLGTLMANVLVNLVTDSLRVKLSFLSRSPLGRRFVFRGRHERKERISFGGRKTHGEIGLQVLHRSYTGYGRKSISSCWLARRMFDGIIHASLFGQDAVTAAIISN
jgi:hypothetical protein